MPSVNATLAKDAYDYVLKHISGSSNLLTKSEEKTDDGQLILKKMDQMREIVIPYPEFSLRWIIAVAKQAKKFQVGNCSEQACLAFSYLLKNAPPGVSIELFNNPFQDHCFVVVGRTKGLSYDISTWNKKAVLCDPWGGCHSLVGTVDLANVEYRPTVFAGVYLSKSSEPTLRTTVLAKANARKDLILVQQPRIVLRQQVESIDTMDLMSDRRWNATIPMTYESWDYPGKSDFAKHKKDVQLKSAIKKQLSTLSIFKTPEEKKAPKATDIVMSYLMACNK